MDTLAFIQGFTLALLTWFIGWAASKWAVYFKNIFS